MSLQFGSNSFYQKLLNETRLRKPAPPPLDKLATPQKNALCSFHFVRAGFLFLLMKRVFFCGVLPSKYSGRWRDWPHFDLAREKRNSPQTPSFLPADCLPASGGGFAPKTFRRTDFSAGFFSLPHPPCAEKFKELPEDSVTKLFKLCIIVLSRNYAIYSILYTIM